MENILTQFCEKVISLTTNCLKNTINEEGIKNLYKNEEELHGCSAEGHISHIYSDRMSSRPMGWS